MAVFEHSYTLIVTQLLTERSISLLQRLLLVTCFPGYNTLDESVSDLGLPIWAYLQEEIADNGIVATKSGLGDPRWPVVKEVFDALVRGLRTKLTLPSSEDFTKWPKGSSRSATCIDTTYINVVHCRHQTEFLSLPRRCGRLFNQCILRIA